MKVLVTVLMILILSGCNFPIGAGAGPMVWFDRPLDGENFPFAPIILMAHAADADGISMIEFLVADVLIGSLPTGGARLEEATLEWTPPGPGVYILNARAIDTLGNTNTRTPASVQVTITGVIATPAPVLTMTPATTLLPPATAQCLAESLVAPLLLSPLDGASITGDPLLMWSFPDTSCHPAYYSVDISDNDSFTDINLGFGTLDSNETNREWPLPTSQCYYWRVLANSPDLKGPPSPVWKFCLSASSTATPSPATITLLMNANCRQGPGKAYDSIETLLQGTSVTIEGRNVESSWFWILNSFGTNRCWVSASVGTANGPWQEVPVVEAPPLSNTSTPEPTDLTPPEISSLSANPTMISVQIQCGATPPTTLIRVRITDSSGVATAVARVPGVGEFVMSPAGDDYYQVNLGPFSEAGTYSIIIQAHDNASNTATSLPVEIQVVACPN